ncbi:MAG TPA: patatin-like phospholipase family protein [Acidimicrobiales bacterium]|nr:patatin-like phospholipase family protein [Acidimicrobiales bacterium]
MRVGLVLGGGGVIGLAYHAASLAAMELDLGWDPRTADVVVGTSAGSLAGALLRRGVPASDLSAITVGAEPRSSPPGTAEALRARPNLPPVRLGHMFGVPRLPSLALVTAWARRPWRVDPFGALASVLPDGKIDLSEHTVAVDGLLGTDWPEDDLWVCTVRQDDLRRVVFGRDAWASLPAAVGASCAVPGYFRPVRIDGRPYIDGGVRSPTNADVLRRRELDLAVVISPMSGRELGLGAGDAIRRRARRQLRHECERLRQAGIPSVVIEPGAEVTAVLGSDFMSNARLQEIVRAAFIDAGEQLRAPITRTLLAGLYGRPRR